MPRALATVRRPGASKPQRHIRHRNTSKSEIKCVCVNARSIINKKTELNIMVDDIKPHIIGITESWANNDITNAELGLEGYVMFRKERQTRKTGRRSITIHQGHYTSI